MMPGLFRFDIWRIATRLDFTCQLTGQLAGAGARTFVWRPDAAVLMRRLFLHGACAADISARGLSFAQASWQQSHIRPATAPWLWRP